VCATLDAYKGEIYAGLFLVENQTPRALSDEEAIAPADLIARLAGDREVVLVGDGARAYPALVEGHRLLDDDPAPRPIDVAKLALDRFARGEHDDLATAGPRYLRPSEPEIQRMKRGKLDPG
jgi:tRNA A37 threonylcarbamoyladenosine modification protein TsaB